MLVQFKILSIRDFVHIEVLFNSGFCPIRNFVHIGILSVRDFVQFGILSDRDFVFLDFIQFGILSVRDFVFLNFVQDPALAVIRNSKTERVAVYNFDVINYEIIYFRPRCVQPTSFCYYRRITCSDILLLSSNINNNQGLRENLFLVNED